MRRRLMDHEPKTPKLYGGTMETGLSAKKNAAIEKATISKVKPKKIDIESPDTLINRELSWLSFARRVLALAEDPDLPLLERVKFASIMGMIYDEFAMKRIGGLKRKIEKKNKKKNCPTAGSPRSKNCKSAKRSCTNRIASFPGWCVVSFAPL